MKSDFFNFHITLVATFIGVFLAIEISNRSESKKVEANVIKYLSATMVDLRQHMNKVENINRTKGFKMIL